MRLTRHLWLGVVVSGLCGCEARVAAAGGEGAPPKAPEVTPPPGATSTASSAVAVQSTPQHLSFNRSPHLRVRYRHANPR